MEQSLIDTIEKYAERIRSTDAYRTYQEQLSLIRQDPEKYRRVNEFRKKNYELQKSEGRDIDFFRAELAFCRMMQEVNLRLTEAVKFDMEFPL